MSLDSRLATIVDEAADVLRSSLRDTVAAALQTLPPPLRALHEVAQKSYELGYREALAARGEPNERGPALTVKSETFPQPLGGATEEAPETIHEVDDSVEEKRGTSFEDLDERAETGPEQAESTVDSSGVSTEDEKEDFVSIGGFDFSTKVDWSGLGDEEEDPSSDEVEEPSAVRARGRSVPSLRIFPHASVSTLRQRIIDAFDLERFEIDVILCRKGDRSRRQLRGSAKLSKYLVGE